MVQPELARPKLQATTRPRTAVTPYFQLCFMISPPRSPIAPRPHSNPISYNDGGYEERTMTSDSAAIGQRPS